MDFLNYIVRNHNTSLVNMFIISAWQLNASLASGVRLAEENMLKKIEIK